MVPPNLIANSISNLSCQQIDVKVYAVMLTDISHFWDGTR